jgi:single-strand DNA-binding protein
MAKSVNKVILLGNVGKDPEIRTTPGGTMVATFGLATSDRYQDPQGNWQDRTEWHNLVAFKRTAEIVRDYVKKGSKLYVEGSLRTSNWEDKQSGQKRYKTEIIVADLSLLSGRDEGSGGYSRSESSSAASSYDQRAPAGHDDLSQSAEISDDDIPF